MRPRPGRHWPEERLEPIAGHAGGTGAQGQSPVLAGSHSHPLDLPQCGQYGECGHGGDRVRRVLHAPLTAGHAGCGHVQKAV